MQLVWITDPHLNHVSADVWDEWIAECQSYNADHFLISGDVSEGDDVTDQLRRLSDALGQPIHFVLGNHDFFKSSIAETRRKVIETARERPPLHYLTDLEPVRLSSKVFLVGEDGWGDATTGDYERSTVRLNDFALIDDFRHSLSSEWKDQLRRLGEQSALRLQQKLAQLPEEAAAVLVVTHVPPFREACWYEGRTTDDNWAPFFVCGEVGKVLRAAAQSRPQCKWTVLCGHTHNEGVARIAKNLTVYTGSADYGHPKVEGCIEVTEKGLTVSLNQSSA